MKNFFVFLFIFMFFSPKTGGSGFLKNIETNKKEFVYTKTVRQSNLKDGQNCDFVVDTTLWHKASASFYDPHDQTQTKNDLNGIGAFGRQVSSGSVALGSSITKTLIKKGIVFPRPCLCQRQGLYCYPQVLTKKDICRKT